MLASAMFAIFLIAATSGYAALLVWGIWATNKLMQRAPRNSREDIWFLGPGAVVMGMFWGMMLIMYGPKYLTP